MDELFTPASLLYWETAIEPLLEHQGHAWDLALELRTEGDKGVPILVNARRATGSTDCLLFPFAERRRYERSLQEARARTDRHKAQIQRLQEIESFQREFIDKIAHELYTPMVPIRLQMDLLMRALDGKVDARMQKGLGIMQANVDKLTRFTSALLTSARMDAHRIGMRMTPVVLDETLPKIVSAWRERHAPHRGIQVETEQLVVRADPTTLAVCLHHLLENAVKFSPPASQVLVEAVAGPQVQIQVIDSGRGIDPKRLAALGPPFAQAHDRLEFTALGAGLGLYIVSGLMHAHGGRLIVESEGRGRGTRAILEFPPGSLIAHR